MTTTLEQMTAFIVGDADDAALEHIIEAVNTRRRGDRIKAETVAAATVTKGATVELAKLSPAYLNGLKGIVSEVDRPRRGKPRATVTLDADSTDVLRYNGSRKFFVAPGVTNYDLHGVPLTCCVTAEASAAE
ncbi:hypothetical protein OG897_39555 [Streptomyces sp. NBC_00237]|uniref:hypothetical protein n=1 Tax=Streptomyces sp. NBC_00237 TaxID=2975687 RepID=UPI002255BB12|nr:hypothetical protein [Streptomyces sp. NBC_00237]MCX5207487.1 hypothetical protein [Streptomyces sp. NBC_00237]